MNMANPQTRLAIRKLLVALLPSCIAYKRRVKTAHIHRIRQLLQMLRSKAFARKFYTFFFLLIVRLHFSMPSVRINRFS